MKWVTTVIATASVVLAQATRAALVQDDPINVSEFSEFSSGNSELPPPPPLGTYECVFPDLEDTQKVIQLVFNPDEQLLNGYRVNDVLRVDYILNGIREGRSYFEYTTSRTPDMQWVVILRDDRFIEQAAYMNAVNAAVGTERPRQHRFVYNPEFNTLVAFNTICENVE